MLGFFRANWFLRFALVSIASQPLASAFAQNIATDSLEDILLFGGELTFSNDELFKQYPNDRVEVQVAYSKAVVDKIEEILRRRLQGIGTVTTKNFHSKWSRKAITVTYPDGFQFTYFSDPGALEVNTSPSSLATVTRNADRFRHDVFAVMKEAGLEPQLFAGSGHIHIDTAKIDAPTLRNFMVDFWNHTGLAAGALNEDVFNSVGPGEMSDSVKARYAAAVASFDAKPNATKGDWVAAVLNGPYSIRMAEEMPEYLNARGTVRHAKYHAISLRSFNDLGTIEIRSIRPEATFESYQKLLRLFVKRMEMARDAARAGQRIPLGPLPSLRGDPQAVLRSFHSYVSGAGLDFNDYKEFVLPWWQAPGGEWDKFVAGLPCSDGFLKQVIAPH